MHTIKTREIYNNLPKYLYLTGSALRTNFTKNKDLDFLTFKPIEKVILDIYQIYPNMKIKKYGKLFCDLVVDGIHLNIWRVNRQNFFYQRLGHDYPKYLVIAMRKKAQALGFKLSQNYFIDDKGNDIKIRNVKDIFDLLNIRYRLPTEN